MNTKPDPRRLEQTPEAAAIAARLRGGFRRTRARRLALLPPVCSARKAAWACLLSSLQIRDFILSGRLPARRTQAFGQLRYEIDRLDVIALAETLE